MSRPILLVLVGSVVLGASWSAQPTGISQTALLISPAQAQTAADHPTSFIDSLAEPPSLEKLTIRQSLYVSAYSNIRLGGGKGDLELATTLTVHNTSQERALILLRVDYYGTAGNLLHRYIPTPIAIRPLGSVQTFVPAQDTRGGTGANFVVEWAADGRITEPLVETVMVGTLGAQGFSFTSRGKAMSIVTP